MHPHPRGRVPSDFHALPIRSLAAASIGWLLILPDAPIATAAEVLAPGYLRQEIYRDIPGYEIADLLGHPGFPGSPDASHYLASFESLLPGEQNNGVRITGFLIPKTTGRHVFHLSGVRTAVLYLSPTEDPALKTRVAADSEWVGSRYWVTDARGGRNTEENISAPVPLEAGHRYYVELLAKNGLDSLAVGLNWRLDNEPPPPNFSPPIGGSHLAAFADPGQAALQWDLHPASLTVTEGEPARFQVRVTASPGPVTYQWQRNGTDIPGAIHPDFSLARATLAEAGATFRCVVTVPGRSATSEPATLLVTPDTQPPRVESAEGGVGLTSITLRFSERLDPGDAVNPDLFTIDGGVAVTGVRLLPDRRSIRLRTTLQVSGREYAVAVRGLRDAAAAGNRMPEDSRIHFVAWEPEEEPGPFASWWDVKRDFGAVGDGTSDDTDAWQQALDSLAFSGNNPQPKAVLHVPAGTYRITRTLEFRSRYGAGVIGEDPGTTTLRWEGPDDGVLLWVDGTRDLRFARLTLHGQSRALSLIDQKRGTGQWPPSANEFSDLILRDAKNGIRAGVDQLDSEVAVLRCRFLRCSETGIRFDSFNAVDWWIWDSLFEDCRYGVANPGGGEGHVYRSLFLRSTEADIAIQQCGSMAYRHNTSVESKAFLVQTCGALTTVQANTIVDPREPTPIRMAAGSTLFLADNVIRTRPEHASHPVISGMGHITALGNVFDTPVPIAPGGPVLAHDNQVLPREQIVIEDHELPGFRVRRSRPVIEIPPPQSEGGGFRHATAEEIQAAIDQAAALNGQRPVVHLPYGDLFLDRTLVIPANSDMQLVGDGFGTRLLWRARTNGTILRVDGPSRATLRGVTLYGNSENPNFASAHALEINGLDQPGSRLLADQLRVQGARRHPSIVLDRLNHLRSEFRGTDHGGALEASSIVAIGRSHPPGSSSPQPLAAFLGGASGDSGSNYDVRDGARLVIQDFWYEGVTNGFLRLAGSGSLTLHGVIVAPSKLEPHDVPFPPAIELAGFQGSLALLQADFRRPAQEILVQPPGTGAHFLVANSVWSLGTPRPVPAAATTAWFNNRSRLAGDPPDLGSLDPAWIEAMLSETREARPSLVGRTPLGSSDVRLHRINIIHPQRGLLVTGSNAPPVIHPIPDQTVAESGTLVVAVSASDPDQPHQTLRFFLDREAPFGASLDPRTGQFTWQTREEHGPAEYVIPVHVADDGSPPQVATLPLRMLVTERNEAPRLGLAGHRLDHAPLTSLDVGIPGDPQYPGSFTENADGSLELVAGGSEARFAEDFIHFAHREITGDFDVRANVVGFDFLHGGARAGIMVRDQLDRRSAALFLAVNPDDPDNNDEYTFYRRPAFGADTDFPGHRSRGVPHPDAWIRLVRNGNQFIAFRGSDGEAWVELGRYDTAGSMPRTVHLGLWGTGLYNFTPEGRIRVRFESFEVRIPDVVPVPAQSLDEGATLRVALAAIDPDLPAQALRFEPGPGTPDGVVVDPVTGVLTWTPSEPEGPGNHVIAVKVTDNGSPALSSEIAIPVAVAEVNRAPVIAPAPPAALDEGQTLAWTPEVSDADLPPNSLTWTLVEAPEGMVLNPETRRVTWTLGETHGGQTFPLTLRVADNGTPPLSVERMFQVVVNEVNSNPVLDPIPPATVTEGQTLEFLVRGTDPLDVPPNALSFAAADLPAGAHFDPATGRFSWTPTPGQAADHPIRFLVRDDGNPPLSASQTVLIRVEPGTPPRLESVERLGGQLRFRWSARPGARYRVQAATSLVPADWQNVLEVVASGESAEYTGSFEDTAHRFFRIVVAR